MKKIKALLLAACIFLSSCSTAEPENADNEQETLTMTLSYDITQSCIVDFSPIDKTLDCEKILLERADALNRMLRDYLNNNSSKVIYQLGDYCTKEGFHDTYKVISDEIKSYDDFKEMFSPYIFGLYIDCINSKCPSLLDIDGELYFHENISGYHGIIETWYLGYDVYDYSIIGHFACLRGISNTVIDEEYLNDEKNYDFYDITIDNIDGEYLITDCGLFSEHGEFYNNGKADRSLITNEKVKPKFAIE